MTKQRDLEVEGERYQKEVRRLRRQFPGTLGDDPIIDDWIRTLGWAYALLETIVTMRRARKPSPEVLAFVTTRMQEMGERIAGDGIWLRDHPKPPSRMRKQG